MESLLGCIELLGKTIDDNGDYTRYGCGIGIWVWVVGYECSSDVVCFDWHEYKPKPTQKGAENFATLRKMALQLLLHNKGKGSLKKARKRTAWNDSYLIQVLKSIPNVISCV